MPRIHRLQHVERFWPTTLADDDPFGTHPQGVFDEVGCRDRTFALDIGWARFKPYDVVLLQLNFRGILDRDDFGPPPG